MIDLGLTKYHDKLKIKKEGDKNYIFDLIRRKWLVLQPEEYVRQLMVEYLIQEKGYSKNLISIEKGLKVNKLDKRYDLVVYDKDLNPVILIECKSPKVKINQQVLDQAGWYNSTLKVKYLVVTNGIQSFVSLIDYEKQSFHFLSTLPSAD